MNSFKSPFENEGKEYPGNIWGWKFSFISLGIIVVLLLLAIYKYSTLDQSTPIFQNQSIIQSDSTDQQQPEKR